MKTRILKGYNVVYKPDHFNAMTSDNWNGYVYEHRYKMEKHLKRALLSKELVHHKDENKKNNRLSNLEIITKSNHGKVHNPRTKPLSYCIDCGIQLRFSRSKRCLKHSYLNFRKVVRPPMEQLLKEKSEMTMVAMGKKYGVSDVAVKKWFKT